MVTVLNNETKSLLVEKIANKNACIGYVGLGYVGLPSALKCLEVGYAVRGFDKNSVKIRKLERGISYISDIQDTEIQDALHTNRFFVSTEMDYINECDVVVICVPTPLERTSKQPDLTYIHSAVDEIVKYIKKGTLIILESTTYPGTTREEVLYKLEQKTNFKIGVDIFVAYSPERIDPANQSFSIQDIIKIVGGVTSNCTDCAAAFYSNLIKDIHKVSSPEVAETAKLLENTYRFINIAFINEMTQICNELNINIWEVIDASGTKPFGFQKFYPGPGVGGHCIPIDPIYFKWIANNKDLATKMIDVAREINENMPKYVLNRALQLLDDKDGKDILMVGVAYKKNVNDARESPALDIMNDLIIEDYNVDYYDPFIEELIVGDNTLKKSIDLNLSQLDKYTLIIVHTDHDCINFKLLNEVNCLILDTRNIFKDESVYKKNIISL
ncbi:UDP-glucose 6-dehydrogenase [Bacillus thuringiensis]|uniref:nucleotide sugar dehydrogenase n=1 Tax=Bacillus TaxID=1386 RepID=UPI000BF36E54|nr:nucleotide sugar dehydrogenase [Bacillus thuringiensis]PEZ37068.1 UDP-glucose 6-dehydrogenase [Bacillus thuringiensis]PGY57388.1 UDP-glucose 6-dehydrogenase [Bacillus thuringiensis]